MANPIMTRSKEGHGSSCRQFTGLLHEAWDSSFAVSSCRLDNRPSCQGSFNSCDRKHLFPASTCKAANFCGPSAVSFQDRHTLDTAVFPYLCQSSESAIRVGFWVAYK